MIKPNRPSEANGSNSGPAVSKPQLRETPERRFHSVEDFSDWLDFELDTLEALFARLRQQRFPEGLLLPIVVFFASS